MTRKACFMFLKGHLQINARAMRKYVELRIIKNVKCRVEVDNVKKWNILCEVASVTSRADVRVLVLFPRTLKVPMLVPTPARVY